MQITDNLVNAVKGSEIEILSQEIFDQDPLTRIENLKVNRPAFIKIVRRERPFAFYRGGGGGGGGKIFEKKNSQDRPSQ